MSQHASPRGRPQVQPRLGVLDGEAGAAERREQPVPPRARTGPLLRARARRRRARPPSPPAPAPARSARACLRTSQQLARPAPGRRRRTRRGSRRGWTASTASAPRARPSWLPPQTSGCSTETGSRVPAELDVALVATRRPCRARAPTRRPCARCSGGSTRPVGFDGELTQTRSDPCRARAASSAVRASPRRRRPASAPTAYVGYASAGTTTRVARARARAASAATRPAPWSRSSAGRRPGRRRRRRAGGAASRPRPRAAAAVPCASG